MTLFRNVRLGCVGSKFLTAMKMLMMMVMMMTSFWNVAHCRLVEVDHLHHRVDRPLKRRSVST